MTAKWSTIAIILGLDPQHERFLTFQNFLYLQFNIHELSNENIGFCHLLVHTCMFLTSCANSTQLRTLWLHSNVFVCSEFVWCLHIHIANDHLSQLYFEIQPILEVNDRPYRSLHNSFN